MKLTYKPLGQAIGSSLLIIAITAALLLTGGISAEHAPAVKPVGAVSSNDFLNTIGANSAIASRGERLEKTIEIVKYTGLRWIRSGYEGDVKMEDYLKLHQQTGLKFSYGLMSGGTDIARLLADGKKLAAARALLAFEGVNEPNNWALTYQGEKGGRTMSWLPVAKLQRNLYAAVKNDTVLKNYPVWDVCENGAQRDNTGLQYLEIPKGAGTLMAEGTKFADYANCHNYFIHSSRPKPVDNQTWNAADPGPLCPVDGLFGNYGTTWGKKFKGYSEQELKRLPKVTTETGATLTEHITEEMQARMFLTLYLSQFKRGWSYTSLYLLRDRSDEAGNQSFGFYKPDYTPRKAALYMHNFTTILADKPSDRKPTSLSYGIPDQPETVHDLLLQNSNGKFQLVVWAEKVSGSDHVNIQLAKKAGSVKIYDPTTGVQPIKSLSNVSTISLELTDHPLILEL
ncbi:MAG: glycosyl hydrolase [Bacteroidota bacterium]